MASPAPAFSFICGTDDYLVARAGKERFQTLLTETNADEFSREIISGFANNVGEVETAVSRFREAVQTLGMFGGRRVIWFKDISFLADTQTGGAEGTLTQVADLQALLATVKAEEVCVLLTAAPIDRRRSFPKWCEKHADYQCFGGGDEAGSGDALREVVRNEARSLGTTITDDAVELLLARTGRSTRLLVEEVRKLATFADEHQAIEENHVATLSPNVAEGDFFETTEAFFKGDLEPTLSALHRHFFTGGDARPLLSSLQNRNRILIQVSALLNSEEVRLGPRGLDGLQKAAAVHGPSFGAALSEKSSFNLFSQNAWYVGKLVQSGRMPKMKRLLDNQRDFVAAFEALIGEDDQEAVLEAMVIRCLGREA